MLMRLLFISAFAIQAAMPSMGSCCTPAKATGQVGGCCGVSCVPDEAPKPHTRSSDSRACDSGLCGDDWSVVCVVCRAVCAADTGSAWAPPLRDGWKPSFDSIGIPAHALGWPALRAADVGMTARDIVLAHAPAGRQRRATLCIWVI